MDNFKTAVIEKITFSTSRGQLLPQQLCDIPLNEHDALCVDLKTKYEESGKKSFLVKTSAKDKLAKLRFDVALELLQYRMDKADEARQLADAKAHNSKIDLLIAEKEDESLKKKSVKELKAMRKPVA